MSSELAGRNCVPCRGGVPPLPPADVRRLLAEIPGWSDRDGRRISREYRFPDFRGAMDFAVRIGDVAEEQGHHPDLHVAWGRVVVEIWTHKIDGLTESDFILAAKIDRVATGGRSRPA